MGLLSVDDEHKGSSVEEFEKKKVWCSGMGGMDSKSDPVSVEHLITWTKSLK